LEIINLIVYPVTIHVHNVWVVLLINVYSVMLVNLELFKMLEVSLLLDLLVYAWMVTTLMV
jgi:hypothetical protein